MMEEKKLDFSNCPGTEKRDILRWSPDKKSIVKVGEEKTDELIQERARGMTISEQLHRLSCGDVSVLRSGDPFYGDVSEVPDFAADAGDAMAKVIQDEASKIAQEKAAKIAEAQKAYEEAQAKLEAVKNENKESE